jgi:hypothetical protein
MDKSDTISRLLHKCLLIQNAREESRKNGDFFNIFKILGLSTNEVRTHSAFISELLDPVGSHGQGDVFLRKFLEIVSDQLSDFDINDLCKATVTKEMYISQIDKNYSEGGNIDILIKIETKTNQIKFIKIENKIYARDQENQLLRYFKYETKSTIALFYLTLSGTSPDKFSTGNLKENDYKIISYKHTIKSWLAKCNDCNKSDDKQIIRNSINQYSNLINMLIMNDNDMLKTMDLLKSKKENLELAKEIKTAYEKLVINKVAEFKNEFRFGNEIPFYFIEANEKRNFEHKKYIFKYGFGQDFCFFYQFYAYEKQIDGTEKAITTEISKYLKNLLQDTNSDFEISAGRGLGWRSPTKLLKLEDSDLIIEAILDEEKSREIFKNIINEFEKDMNKFIEAINDSKKINDNN